MTLAGWQEWALQTKDMQWIYSERGVWCPLTFDVDVDVDVNVDVVVVDVDVVVVDVDVDVVVVVVSVCALSILWSCSLWLLRSKTSSIHLSSSARPAIRNIRNLAAHAQILDIQVCFILSSRRTLRHSLLEWWGLRGKLGSFPKQVRTRHDFATSKMLWTLEPSPNAAFSRLVRLFFWPLGLPSGYST